MKVAVITPYHEPNNPQLLQCVESVEKQTYENCFHVLVGDGCHSELIEPGRAMMLSISDNINDFGDTPRSLGVIYAFAKGADAVAFLDSDNWFEPEHIESLVDLHKRTGAPVVCSHRKIVHMDGHFMGLCPDSDALGFTDTNCLMLTKEASDVAASWWQIPEDHHPIDDRVIWDRLLSKGFAIACTKQATSNYRSTFANHYAMFGEEVPDFVKDLSPYFYLAPEVDRLTDRALELAPKLICNTKESA